MRDYKTIYFFLILLISPVMLCQNNHRLLILDSLNHRALPGATVRLQAAGTGAATDNDGFIDFPFKNSRDTLLISFVGYTTRSIAVEQIAEQVVASGGPVSIFLSPTDIEYSQAVVTSSRINSYISASPKRIEIVGDEEITEKIMENPANISELLSELSAVQMTQSSLLNGSTNFRLLGLPGRFTLLLKDGFPLFGGAAQELSFMQLLPLDLQQVEIIKGASSALYGNGAVGGVINLITRQPTGKPELRAVASANTFRGTAAGVYYSQRNNDVGFSLNASADNKAAVDVSHDGFTDIPQVNKFVVEPSFHYYADSATEYYAKLTLLNEKRIGGEYNALALGNGFIQHDNTNSITGYFSGNSKLNETWSWTVKAGFMHLNNSSDIPSVSLDRQQRTYFGEATTCASFSNHSAVFGASVLDERTRINTSPENRDEQLQTTAGVFVFDEFRFSKALTMQIGMRYDRNNLYKGFFSPDFSGMYKFNDLSFIRLSMSTAYKTPGLYAEDDGNFAGSSILPTAGMKAEQAQSIMLDGSYKFSPFEDVFISLNQVFFHAEIKNPIALQFNQAMGRYYQVNQPSSITGNGMETNIRVTAEDIKFYLGASIERTERLYSANKRYPLSPDFKIVHILSFEDEGNWEFDIGGIYYGRQYLSNGTRVRQYATYEAAFIKKLGNLKVVVNCENIGSIKQSDYMPLVVPSPSGPKFNEVWAPVDGRMFVVTVLYNL